MFFDWAVCVLANGRDGNAVKSSYRPGSTTRSVGSHQASCLTSFGLVPDRFVPDPLEHEVNPCRNDAFFTALDVWVWTL